MAKGPISEERQEERLIQDLRDFQRSIPANKRCFDCNEMMPQYVCLDFNTFVCTACSGIHREFAHRVKSISMSKFTESEVKNMIKRGGNEAAQKFWRSKHDPSFRPNGGTDGERTRNFIRLTYIDRKWVYGSADEETKQTSMKSSKKERKADSGNILRNSSLQSTKTTEFADFSNFDNSSTLSTTVIQSFEDFSSFDSPALPNTTDDFGSLGDSSKLSKTAKLVTVDKIPVPQVPKFGSFKIAPPPGSNFSTSKASVPSATNDIMGLSTRQKPDDDLFGFNHTALAPDILNHATPALPSPSIAHEASAPTSQPDNMQNAAAILNPFTDVTAVVPSTIASTQQNASLFDAFGSPSAPSPSVFDGLAAISPAINPDRNVTDAFGGSGDVFGAFAGSNSAKRTASSNPAMDPFARKPDSSVSVSAADSFPAFLETLPSTSGEASISNVGSSDAYPAGNSFSQQHCVMADPFQYAGGMSSSNNDVMAAQQQFRAGNVNNPQFGGFNAGFPQQSMPSNLYGSQVQQQTALYRSPPQPEQHIWNGQQGGMSRFQHANHLTALRPPGQFQAPLAESIAPASSSVKISGSNASVNDPFASLNLSNLGFGSSNSKAEASCTSCGGVTGLTTQAPASQKGFNSYPGNTPATSVSSGPSSNAQSQDQTPTFAYPLQNIPADMNAFGNFARAPTPVQMPPSPANPFDLF
ncbi:Predicted GTPase-activating protein [Plasmopara halstedii]|uniref:Predicted GTPase-activating protein n=1 Tax=Plasmopara halstedii TaxID=4781 RepID=A0A0P1AU20_PLAHL|nr:Predicted GTPase-activating protein [Plasmopara halstedii]CEG44892.1 Predicted GTPase-activating protein [Plasmopara halstedii]|eukprot:XP_024581261.1 Predicted GTPase-activating protein [Plasmopara halstedii]